MLAHQTPRLVEEHRSVAHQTERGLEERGRIVIGYQDVDESGLDRVARAEVTIVRPAEEQVGAPIAMLRPRSRALTAATCVTGNSHR